MTLENNFKTEDMLKLGFYVSLLALIWNLPTLGNNLMPRNFMGWFGVVFIATLILSFVLLQKKLKFKSHLLLLFLPPLAILLHGLIFSPTETMSYYLWLAFGATFAFSALMMALIQIKDSSFVWLKIANTLLFVFALQVFITEILPGFSFGRFLLSQIPIEMRADKGGFQQPNLMASFAGAVILWSWALRLNYEVSTKRSWAYLSIFAFILSFVIFQTGSRTGILGMMSGLIILTFFSYKKKRLGYSLIVVCVILLALIAENIGGIGASLKSSSIDAVASIGASDFNTTIRITFWHVSFLSGLESWIFGHGLGNFSESYYKTFAANKFEHPNWGFLPNLVHPHNEIFMQWVEMGLYGLVLVVAPYAYFLMRYFLSLSTSPWLALAALIPIGMHTQTEMALHASGAHWLLMGLILASFFKSDNANTYPVKKVAIILPVFFGVLGLFVCLDTSQVGKQAWENKIYSEKTRNTEEFLKRVSRGRELSHWILSTETNDRVLKSMVAYALLKNNRKAIRTFLPRLIDIGNRMQTPIVWDFIAESYLALGDLDSYKKYIQYVKAFDPKYVEKLEKKFNVTEN